MTTPRDRVLVTFGSKRGGTAEIAMAIARTLREQGHETDCMPAASVRNLGPYRAVIIGGALYARRWSREARAFVRRYEAALRTRHVWMFSSGPLDPSANQRDIPPVPGVAALAARVGSRSHVTFGGRLAPDAKGFIASAMAKTHAGDWRDWEKIRAWTDDVAHALVTAPPPRATIPRPARWLLAMLCLVTGITAIAGGIALVAAPDGSLVRMPLSTLEYSPFSSFLVPGLILLFVVGFGNMLAASAVLRDAPSANALSFVAGVALLGWILGQIMFLRTANWLQLGYLAVALLIIGESFRRTTILRTRPPPHAMGT